MCFKDSESGLGRAVEEVGEGIEEGNDSRIHPLILCFSSLVKTSEMLQMVQSYLKKKKEKKSFFLNKTFPFLMRFHFSALLSVCWEF